MLASTEFASFLRDQLSPLGDVTLRRMVRRHFDRGAGDLPSLVRCRALRRLDVLPQEQHARLAEPFTAC